MVHLRSAAEGFYTDYSPPLPHPSLCLPHKDGIGLRAASLQMDYEAQNDHTLSHT